MDGWRPIYHSMTKHDQCNDINFIITFLKTLLLRTRNRGDDGEQRKGSLIKVGAEGELQEQVAFEGGHCNSSQDGRLLDSLIQVHTYLYLYTTNRPIL